MSNFAVLTSLLLFQSLATAAVPTVPAGPEALEKSLLIQSPIEKVIVFSDRAQILRKTTLSLNKGANLIRIEDLPGALLLNTLRVKSNKAQVLRIQPNVVQKERYKLQEVNELIDKMEAIQEKINRLDKQKNTHQNELTLLNQANPAFPLPEADRKSPAPMVTSSWKLSLDFLEQRRKSAREEIRKIDLKRRAYEAELNVLKRESAPYRVGKTSESRVELSAILYSSKKQTVSLELFFQFLVFKIRVLLFSSPVT